MKKIKHIWKYLTSSTYRHWVDFYSLQENLDRNMKMIEDNLRLGSYPMFYIENKDGKEVIERLNNPLTPISR